jgi:type VI secretion system protein ImpE
MNVEGRLRLDDPEEAITLLQDQVRKDPANPQKRIFLFQLLAVLGQWERSLAQLKVAGELAPDALSMVQTYQEALRCELLRAQVFSGERTPLVFGKPDPWMALALEALRLTGGGKHQEAQRMRLEAFEQAPAIAGRIDGQPFEWIADADGRLGPFLEVITSGRYYWMPFQRIRVLKIEKPADLRDLIWTPAYLTLANGGEMVGLIPTRYPGSESSKDREIRMARKTDWIEAPGETYLGAGQRLLATDQAEYPIMDVREIVLDTAPSLAAAAEGEADEPSVERVGPHG